MSDFMVDLQTLTVETPLLSYQYGLGYLHNGDGYSINHFADKRTGQNVAYGFDGQYKQRWSDQRVQFTSVSVSGSYVDVEVTTGLTQKIDRVYRDKPIVELIYLQNDADWTEDFIRVNGAEEDVTFVMHGAPDVVGLSAGKALWDASEKLCGHNYGDCFLRANRTTVEACDYKGHFIYGCIDAASGRGSGFVYPIWITVQEWKVWWTETHKLEIEYAPHQKTGRRWIYAVTGGKAEALDMGRWIVDTLAVSG